MSKILIQNYISTIRKCIRNNKCPTNSTTISIHWTTSTTIWTGSRTLILNHLKKQNHSKTIKTPTFFPSELNSYHKKQVSSILCYDFFYLFCIFLVVNFHWSMNIVMLHIIPYLAMGHRIACHPPVKHLLVKSIVHKVRFHQIHYQAHMFRIPENEKHIQRRK